jgi:hypothetical protein
MTTPTPAGILAATRVDLVDLIHAGIPAPKFVPGGDPWLRAGKRYLIPAPAGTGKSIAALTLSVGVVEAGGTVVILDVENGADEYARRLEDILRARDTDGTLTAACRELLGYHDWPHLSLTWSAGDWAAAIQGADLVIFDSSRLTLSSVGLDEDSSNDYSTFITALIVPLTMAGSTTIVLDNTGHLEKDRARGTSAKGDLNEVVYKLEVGAPFDRDKAGHLRLIRTRTRFSLPAELHIHVGGDTYTPPVVVDKPAVERSFRPTHLMEKASHVVEATPGLTRNAIVTAVGGKKDYAQQAVELLVTEGYILTAKGANRAILHQSANPYREAQDPGWDRAPRVPPECPPDPPGATGASGPPPLRGGHPKTHPAGPTRTTPVGPDPDADLARLTAKFGAHA